MNKRLLLSAMASALLIFASCIHKPKLTVSLSDKFEGQTVELVNFLDSTTIATATVTDGKAELTGNTDYIEFAALMIDGRTRAFYITEPGHATVNDSTNSASGTPLNDRFATLLTRLDSIEDTNNMFAYLDFVKKAYNENKDNPLGSYFGLEWIKYAEYAEVDSLLKDASDVLKNSPKVKHYVDFAKLRDNTAPGKPYIDFEGEDANGNQVMLSSFVKPGQYTLVDFWASWCPYCIKELPELAALHERWKNMGLNVVGVAVRDVPDDSKAAINKHNITWPVMFNTQRRPYDIYGFSGIPHHILIGPHGNIISRGESVEQLRKRLTTLLSTQNSSFF